MTTKRCGHCHNEQPMTDFTSDKKFKDGLYPVCRACRAALWQERKARDPEKMRTQAREAMRRWREDPTNREKAAEYQAAYRAARTDEEIKRDREENRQRMLLPHNQRRTKNRYTLHKYGLTLFEYEGVYARLLRQQQGVCAVCGDAPSDKEPLNLDHHHETGTVRALLCGHCNRALGLLREDPKRIAALLAYVEKQH
jgi:hypothetical protein